MSALGRFIKKIAYSKAVPDAFSDWYFDQKNKRNKIYLLNQLAEKGEMIQLMNEKSKAHWLPRIQKVSSGQDNQFIPRDKTAGKIIDGFLMMHNGVKIEPLSYYNYGMLKMLIDNKGVHEPQEERIFQEVLAGLAADKNFTMLELGAYWSFYSMWFLKSFPKSRCIMVEPDRMNLFYGKANFKANNLNGDFVLAGIGKEVDSENSITTVDTVCQQKGIEFLDILHSDIQGFEYDMLIGSKRMLSEKRVGYVFVSTHSNELHESCYKILKEEYNFSLVASANLDESCSWDGILVMKAPGYAGISEVTISKN